MQTEPISPRYSIQQTPNGLVMSVPGRRNVLVVFFLCCWLVAWAFGERTVLHQLLSPGAHRDNLFLCVWLIGWTAGGGYCLLSIAWQLFGKEQIAVDGTELIHRVQIFGIGPVRRFKVSNIARLRAVDFNIGPSYRQAALSAPMFGTNFGPIAFDYGARSVRLGRSLDETEAFQLVAALKQRLPSAVFPAP